MEEGEEDFRHLMHSIMEGLTSENVKMIRYLCKDAIPNGRQLNTALSFLQYFEDKGWINFDDMSFLAEVLYRINRQDLLKKLPGVKNRRDYEDFLLNQRAQNFTPFRIACFMLVDELTQHEFRMLKNLFRDKLSVRNFNRSEDVISFLVCLEEEDLVYEDDLDCLLNNLKRLDNQKPYKTFLKLRNGDTSYVLPRRHQSTSQLQQMDYNRDKQFHSHHSLPNMQSTSHYKVYNPAFLSHVPGQAVNYGEPSGYPSTSFQPSYQPNFQMSSRTFGGPDDGDVLKYGQGPSTTVANCSQVPEHETCPKQSAYVAEIPFRTSSAPAEHSLTTVNDCGASYPEEPSVNQFSGMQTEDETHQSVTNEETLVSSLEEKIQVSNVEGEVERLEGDCYSMENDPCGICLIINNEKFEGQVNTEEVQRRVALQSKDFQVPNTSFKDRAGSRNDLESISTLMESFGFCVKTYENLGHREIKKALLDCANSDHTMYDCFVCIIMSHGLEGIIYGIDGMPVSTTKIKNTFKPEKCPSLTNKPKLFFFQACQGDRSMVGHSSSPMADIETDSSQSVIELTNVPSEADFLISHSTVPGYVSYRNRQNGSWFINALVDNLAAHHERDDLLNILTRVNNQISQYPLFKQMPMPIYTLRKKVYFKKRRKDAKTVVAEPVAQTATFSLPVQNQDHEN